MNCPSLLRSVTKGVSKQDRGTYSRVLGMVAAVLCLANLSSTAAEPSTIVVPRDLANCFGSQGASINVYSLQHVYSSSQFADAAGDQLTITAVAFRWDETTPSFSHVLPDIGINMGTFDKPLTEFSHRAELNWGADQKLVVAARDLRIIAERPASPSDFGLKLELAEPFLYDRSKGNFLIQVEIRGGTFAGLDAEIYPSRDVVLATSPTMPGIYPVSLAMQFSYSVIPEPSAEYLFALGVAGIWALSSRRAR